MIDGAAGTERNTPGYIQPCVVIFDVLFFYFTSLFHDTYEPMKSHYSATHFPLPFKPEELKHNLYEYIMLIQVEGQKK